MANALAHETSPSLLQHADQPVDWLPWGARAWAKARAEGKPIFLSSGYSTCHWCHVMAHESFEDAQVAETLNAHFVPVKLDREERPDVDKVYLAYVQAMTGRGGWPLNVWLTPDLKPFYGGTYFPPEDRPGRAGLATILRAIADGWTREREKLVAEGERALAALREASVPAAAGTPAGGGLAEAAGQAFERGFEFFYESFDPQHAGFGPAPKFPRPCALNFLLRVAALQGPAEGMGAEAVRMTAATLEAMARGGIHDHIGGGFHRYAVDEAWRVPHFEKMLTDQALLAATCLETRQATGDARFGWLARDILGYLRGELAGPAGAFFTAEDADSPAGPGGRKTEGAFYVWTADELRAALATSGEPVPPEREAEEPAARGGGADYAWVAAHYGIEPDGNVPPALDPAGELRGRNVPVQRRPFLDTAKAAGLEPAAAAAKLEALRRHLRTVRARRPRPELDDKIVAAGNGLAISALARAHQVLGAEPADGEEPGVWLEAAARAARFLAQEMYDPDTGVLYRTWRLHRGDTPALAEDYAYLIQGLLDLYEAGFDGRWLRWARRLQETMDRQFRDEADGGYFGSVAGDPGIVLRLKDDYDGAEPAAGSVATMNLLRLGVLFDAPGAADGYRARGLQCLEAFRARWSRSPQALPQMLCALELALEPPRHAAIAGDPAAPDFAALTAVLHERLGPRRALLAADGGETHRWLAERLPWLAELKPRGGRATVYLCEDYSCQAPVSDPAELRQLLGAGRA